MKLTNQDEMVQRLLPAYLDNRRSDLQTLATALEQRDFDSIYRLGHNLKGSGRAYGLAEFTQLGEQLEAAAKQEDNATIQSLLNTLGELADDLEKALLDAGLK